MRTKREFLSLTLVLALTLAAGGCRSDAADPAPPSAAAAAASASAPGGSRGTTLPSRQARPTVPPFDAADPYRPVTHYTPATNWMNDPNGLVYYDGEYHLFYQYNPHGSDWGNMSWGHAVSADLVHWKELDVAIAATERYGVFSGSAVIDEKNTSGFGSPGKPAMVAIWTRNETVDGKQVQSQSLAYSTDRGRTWSLHNDGAPVLDIGAKDFRDPKVFWDEQSKRWTMALALSEERKVAFYSSPDLKNWTFQSDFGPAGDTGAIWECPDLFPMRLDGKRGETRWVLTVNASATAQYFVGEWDGSKFTANLPPAYDGQGSVLADFEADSYGGWTARGDALGSAPARGDLPGRRGNGYVDTFGPGDAATGSLTSPEFTIDADRLNLLVAGGRHPYESGAGQRSNASVNVVVEGKVVASATGNDSGTMAWRSLDLRKWKGRKAKVVIEDNNTTGRWGHIMVDHLVLSDTPAVDPTDVVPKVDYGKDYYASVTWNGAPGGNRYAIGWMSNWAYAKDVPTTTWRTAMSTVRKLDLRTVDGRERLVSTPVGTLDSLRVGKEYSKSEIEVPAGVKTLGEEASGRSLDVSLALDPGDAQASGITVLSDGKQGTKIYYDALEGRLVVDRSRSGNTGFSPSFGGSSSVDATPGRDGLVRLRVIVDASSVEVFAEGGALVLTETVYPPRGAEKVELFARGGTAKVRDLKVRKLGSYR